MDEYELSLDSIFFFDAQVVSTPGKTFIASVVWLYNFQWNSWIRGRDGDEILVNHMKKADAVVSFSENARLMALMRAEFGFSHEYYINLVDYCDGKLLEMAKSLGIDYHPELEHFDESHPNSLWIDYKKDNYDALDTLLFVSAWHTSLIYNIFFQVSGGIVPIKVFIPWGLETPVLSKKRVKYVPKTKDEKLRSKLEDAYDFTGPCASIDD